MIETPNLKLEKYELNDAANLADGYNRSMDLIDAAYKNNEDRFPITSSDIEDGTINTVDIANGSITTNKLATEAVTSDKIENGTVTSDKIENGAVTSDKIENGTVTSDKIENGAVTSDKIENGAVTSDKIENGAIDENKLSANVMAMISALFTFGSEESIENLDPRTSVVTSIPGFPSILPTNVLTQAEFNAKYGSPEKFTYFPKFVKNKNSSLFKLYPFFGFYGTINQNSTNNKAVIFKTSFHLDNVNEAYIIAGGTMIMETGSPFDPTQPNHQIIIGSGNAIYIGSDGYIYIYLFPTSATYPATFTRHMLIIPSSIYVNQNFNDDNLQEIVMSRQIESAKTANMKAGIPIA